MTTYDHSDQGIFHLDKDLFLRNYRRVIILGHPVLYMGYNVGKGWVKCDEKYFRIELFRARDILGKASWSSSSGIHCSCSIGRCVSPFKYKFKQFFRAVMMDPRKIGIKCARHFMTGAEHLLSIFYSGFHCKKAPSPKLHSFPFP